MDRKEHARRLAASGFSIFPLRSSGTANEQKRPAFEHWQDYAKPSARWWDNHPDANIGIKTGNGLLVLDFDVKKGGLESLALMDDLGLPAGKRVRTRSGGMHVYLRCEGPVPTSVDDLTGFPGVDVRADGGLVVAPGSAIEGSAYEDLGGEPAQAPDWIIDLCRKAKKQPILSDTKAPLVELDTDAAIKRAIDYLKGPAPSAIQGDAGDSTTYRVAAQLREFGLSERTAIDLMLEHWNEVKAQPPWPADDLERKVTNAFAYATGGWGGASALNDFDAVPVATKLPIVGLGDLKWEPKSNYLVQDLLNAGMIGLVTGVSNTGKSPFALDLGAHIALGKPWHGRKIKRGFVLYIATEGWTALTNRLEAIRREHFEKIERPAIAYAAMGLNLRSPPKGFVESLIDDVLALAAEHGLPPALIVVDTLSPALGGATDKDDDVARAVLATCRKITTGTGAAMLLLHHPTKAADSDYRGSSVWTNDTDILIKIDMDREREVRTVTTPRVKESGEIEPLAYRIQKVVLGESPDGDPVTSVVVKWLGKADELNGFRSRSDEAALDAIEELMESDPDGATYTDWRRAWAFEMGIALEDRIGRTRAQSEFNNSQIRLRKDGLVRKSKSNKWLRTEATRALQEDIKSLGATETQHSNIKP